MVEQVNIKRLRREAKTLRIKHKNNMRDYDDCPSWVIAYAKLFEKSANEIEALRSVNGESENNGN